MNDGKQQKWIWPYDMSMKDELHCTLGGIYQNIKSVMGPNVLLWLLPTPAGWGSGLDKHERDPAGVIWPLGPRAKAHNLTQYTLPLEERAQSDARGVEAHPCEDVSDEHNEHGDGVSDDESSDDGE